MCYFISRSGFCVQLQENIKRKNLTKIFLWFLLDLVLSLHLSFLLSGPSSHVALNSLVHSWCPSAGFQVFTTSVRLFWRSFVDLYNIFLSLLSPLWSIMPTLLVQDLNLSCTLGPYAPVRSPSSPPPVLTVVTVHLPAFLVFLCAVLSVGLKGPEILTCV